MTYNSQEIKKGIKSHLINTDKFKTNLISLFLTTPLDRKTVTNNALIAAILRRGTKNFKTMEEISIALENMYGAGFDCGVEKTGDNQVLKFYVECINDKYAPQKEELLKKSLEILLEIVLNPLVEDEGFIKDYLSQEKENLKSIIESKIDDKEQYSQDRCIEEMYKDKPHGLYRYGYVEDLEKINEKELYESYKQLIKEAKIDIFASGEFNDEDVINIINENENIKNLNEREPKYITNNNPEVIGEPNIVKDTLDITQGKLVIGLHVGVDALGDPESKYIISLYNTILGGSPNSKMFQNVREKESLAYTARSKYMRQKNNIYISCGIEIEKYEKAVTIIKEQLEDLKNGKFEDEEIENAKRYITTGIKMLEDEQDSFITYALGQELSNGNVDTKEYIEKINTVTKEQIIDIASKIQINTIYFLTNK